ncbi:hypothetical protein [Streptomyces sp. NPDC056227]|uniref:hypothetical protein n=1 Tax=Streptomyces sp. NPDC056227 TaxID=3345753 RepID=UPI0035DBC540
MGAMGLRADVVTVHAVDGVVTLECQLESQNQIAILTCLAEQLDGVVAVVSHVSAPVDGSVPASSQWTAHGVSAEP